MLLVLVIAGVIWGAGLLTGAPVRLRLAGIGLLWLGVVLGHVVLPERHGLRLATGGSAAPWLLLGGMVAVVMGYRAALGWLKRRVHVPEPVVADGPFREAELRRYARHIILREVGGPGQVKLKQARVLVIGAGGLGSPALMYLAAAGVGTIGLIDDDSVDATNLQRQVIHGDADIGRPKVQSATDRLRGLNPFVEIRPYGRRLVAEEAEALFADYDVILDGTDNFDTRYLVNRVAAAQGKPLISGALTQWEGQVSVFDPALGDPCYQCVFPEAPAPGLAPSCAEAGVIGPLPGVVGSMMAVEAVKVITGAGAALRGEMLIYDALWGETRKIRVKPRADCPVCHGRGLAKDTGRA
ncbi:molybdopterin biosynthesis protein [Primorskyibacter flagellatus]|uniref:Molybdopterin-synthase adenylyltransferase n=1 Tax=Primorskyibacter flagellatus TaxID=1387277 RepID=A0A917E9T4_9RHOB|nr:HesA/MoeB/ThiF family protein [Primorskyibacter flagellatus]GGE17971.1 molybdopterin biosynthesis protein [Primorskyibacter flagellatus]